MLREFLVLAMSTVALILSASLVFAYGLEPEKQLEAPTQINPSQMAELCEAPTAPQMAAIFGLPTMQGCNQR